MDLNELQSVRDRERQTDKLQQLRESFYADAGTFIQQLHAERDRAAERAEDPFDSTEVRQLSDEIKTAEQTVEAIYEKRVGKIVKAASFAAADLPAEVEGMTAEEQALFEDLVGDIEQNRQRVLDLLDGEETTGPSTGSEPADEARDHAGAPADSSDPGDAGADSVSAADVMGDTGEESGSTRSPAAGDADASGSRENPPAPGPADAPPAAEPVDPPVRNDGGRDTVPDAGATPSDEGGQSTASTDDPGVDRQRVQILEDVETFLGFDDRDYDLEPDDVVSLPVTNADILLERGVAREL